jgi:hypothetical protein
VGGRGGGGAWPPPPPATATDPSDGPFDIERQAA